MDVSILEPKIRFDFSVKALEVSQRHEIIETNKTGSGKEDVQSISRNLGWFVRVGPHISIFVGMEKPDIEVGDYLRLVLFKPDAPRNFLQVDASEAEHAQIESKKVAAS